MQEYNYFDQLAMVENAKAMLSNNEAGIFNRYIAGELNVDQLSLYRREHYIRTQLLKVAHEQLGDILLSAD